MNVTSVCSERGVIIRPVPAGTALSPEGIADHESITALSELNWALNALKQVQALKPTVDAVLIPPGQEGSLRAHTWELWAAATNDLASQSGIPAIDLSLDVVISEVVRRLEAESNTQNAGDIARLKGLLLELKPVYDRIRSGFTNSAEHPLVAEYSQASHMDNRGLRLELRAIVEKIGQVIPAELRSQINLSLIYWNSPTVASIDTVIGNLLPMITLECTGLAAEIPQPPAITPPVVPPPPPPDEEGLKLKYELSLSPAYTLNVAGGADNQMGLSGFGGLRLDFNEDMSLQINYQAGLNLTQDFSSSQTGADSASVNFAYGWAVIQAGYLWLNNFADGSAEHLGNLGFGANLMDGKLYPFAGGLAGTTFGGYAGVSGGYTFDDLMKLSIRAQAYYEYLNGHQAGGQVSLGFSPVSFLGNDLNLGVSAGGYYLVDPNIAAMAFGLQLSYGNILNPQPMNVQSAAQGGF